MLTRSAPVPTLEGEDGIDPSLVMQSHSPLLTSPLLCSALLSFPLLSFPPEGEDGIDPSLVIQSHSPSSVISVSDQVRCNPWAGWLRLVLSRVPGC